MPYSTFSSSSDEDKDKKNNPIISKDPLDPIDEKVNRYLVEDILRTKYCIVGSIFLVEGIDQIEIGNKGRSSRRAIRVLLSDGGGGMVIQGLVKPEGHWIVDCGWVREGGYVRLDRVEVGVVDEGGEVVLLIGDMVCVGWNREWLRVFGGEEGVIPGGVGGKGTEVGGEEEGEYVGVGDGEEEEGDVEVEDSEEDEIMEEVLRMVEEEQGGKDVTVPSFPVAVDAREKVVEKEEEDDYISDSDDEAFEALQVSTERALARRVTAVVTEQDQHLETMEQDEPALPSPQQQPPPPPWMAQDPTQPLKLTPLNKVPNLPYKQNWMMNVLAVVVSLSEVESCTIPPYIQRTARLADLSTAKHVHLTVFLEPQKFTPEVGKVVLLVGVKNHRFDGGSLKKYVSDRLRGGKDWWVRRPGEFGWCEEEVERLEGWWGGRRG
ncbi:hypothetical protein QBC38DRAFT_522462 [Podospora fimiseda]|uniref:Uncharacterized protein n=1 Tax=Podospora fimiseda TaxID=252190 RepID=A0AAN7H1T5_9PEZI|nr:hypothetical protein QBC38DRAFT_522462 [Podospora fimiseda]